MVLRRRSRRRHRGQRLTGGSRASNGAWVRIPGAENHDPTVTSAEARCWHVCVRVSRLSLGSLGARSGARSKSPRDRRLTCDLREPRACICPPFSVGRKEPITGAERRRAHAAGIDVLVRDYTCPGPWGFIARAAQRNFVLWGWGIPPRVRHWCLSAPPTAQARARRARTRATSRSVPGWIVGSGG